MPRNLPRRISPSVFFGFEQEFFQIKLQNVTVLMVPKVVMWQGNAKCVFYSTQPHVFWPDE